MRHRSTLLAFAILTFVIAWCAVGACQAPQVKAALIPSAPAPARITSAQRVLVSNAGADLTSEQYFKKEGT